MPEHSCIQLCAVAEHGSALSPLVGLSALAVAVVALWQSWGLWAAWHMADQVGSCNELATIRFNESQQGNPSSPEQHGSSIRAMDTADYKDGTTQKRITRDSNVEKWSR